MKTATTPAAAEAVKEWPDNALYYAEDQIVGVLRAIAHAGNNLFKIGHAQAEPMHEAYRAFRLADWGRGPYRLVIDQSPYASDPVEYLIRDQDELRGMVQTFIDPVWDQLYDQRYPRFAETDVTVPSAVISAMHELEDVYDLLGYRPVNNGRGWLLPNWWAYALDETQYWAFMEPGSPTPRGLRDGDRETVEGIFGAYITDRSERTHLCSLTPSSYFIQYDTFVRFKDQDVDDHIIDRVENFVRTGDGMMNGYRDAAEMEAMFDNPHHTLKRDLSGGIIVPFSSNGSGGDFNADPNDRYGWAERVYREMQDAVIQGVSSNVPF